MSRLVFVDDILLTDNDLNKAIDLVSDIDEDDALFVALTNHLSGKLWTGDNQLITGLRKKGYSRIIITSELFEIFLNRQLKIKKSKGK